MAPSPAPAARPEPGDDLADLSDAEQVQLIEPTDNDLSAGDEGLPQPPQDGSYQPVVE
jgi:hypothetical protein